MAPNLGRGGGCALTNGLALAVALSEQPSLEVALQRRVMRERPHTEHTQRVSALYGRVTTLPPSVRGAVLWLAGKSQWAMEQRMRTGLPLPTAASA